MGIFKKLKKTLSYIYHKNIFKIIFKNYNFYLLKNLRKNLMNKINGYGFIILFSKNIFISHTIRPNKFKEKILTNKLVNSFDDFALIIQGPLDLKHNFTLETLKYYKLNYDCKIILSTWEGENINIMNEIKELDIDVLINKKPKTSGWGNINYQTQSTYNAIKYAKHLGKKYVAKTRTDTRIYSIDFLYYCSHLLRSYKLKTNQNRIITLGTIATKKYLPFALSDLFQFGAINEMIEFWSPNSWEKDIKSIFNNKTIINETPIVAEIFLASRYYIKKFKKINFELKDWWLFIKNEVIIIDPCSIDFFWHKYDYEHENSFYQSYNIKHSKQFSHIDWLYLQENDISKFDFNKINSLREKWENCDKNLIRKKRIR